MHNNTNSTDIRQFWERWSGGCNKDFYHLRNPVSINQNPPSATESTYMMRQESPADAVKPARRKSMHKLLQFDVFRFISPNSISPNCQCIASASRGMFSQALGLYCYTQFEIRKSGVCQL